MKRKNLSFIMGAVFLAGSAMFLSCSENDFASEIVEQDAAATKNIPASFKVYTITKPGTYYISGTVKGQYIDIKSKGKVVIQGVGSNPTFQGQSYSGQARSSSHIRGGSDELIIQNFTFKGKVGHNFMSLRGNGKKTIKNLTVINNTKAGAGAINPGPNSNVTGCYIEPHDDAIKVTENNSRANNNVIKMDGNGSAIQLGWGKRSNGAIHYATNTKISGFLLCNKQTNTCNNPGRSIIGGIFENNVSDIKVTGLDINMASNHNGHYVKLRANGGSVNKVVIEGKIRNTVKVKAGIQPIALSTARGAKISNISIDFKGKIKANQVYKDKGVVGFTLK
ncbi:MAG: hypothetical protein MI922_07080 [Bacteroidales bacterium]|nr:hypothetical protein [Bacteroidales bacterium]